MKDATTEGASEMNTLRRHVSGTIARNQRSLGVPERHQLKIARDTMKMHCTGALIMGGMNHREALAVIHKLTGAIVGTPEGCSCFNAR